MTIEKINSVMVGGPYDGKIFKINKHINILTLFEDLEEESVCHLYKKVRNRKFEWLKVITLEEFMYHFKQELYKKGFSYSEAEDFIDKNMKN